MTITYAWRGDFDNADVNVLHADGFRHAVLNIDRLTQVRRHSLGWVCARGGDGTLVGFVNVAWDGGVHAFVLDTVVTDHHTNSRCISFRYRTSSEDNPIGPPSSPRRAPSGPRMGGSAVRGHLPRGQGGHHPCPCRRRSGDP
ncbi:hypothetical protein ACIQNG_21125 [Streptomyces sp. NPDC091377]|uniref:hypothetical protein n=1 Tax=Streptomyces sp. NPDC091377 TaxID=3365995 RepID=UPI003814F50A